MNDITSNTSPSPNTSVPEKKPKVEQIAIRLAPDTKERFARYCSENNYSQSEALQNLLDIYKVQQDAEQNPFQAENLRRFQHNLQSLLIIYNNSVLRADDARDLAREECATELAQNAETIQALRAQINTLNKELTVRTSEKDQLEKSLQAAADHASVLESQYQQVQSQLSDKASLVSILESKLPETDSLLAELETLRATERKQKEEISSLHNAIQQSKLEHAEELRQLDNAHSAELRAVEADKHEAKEALARAMAQLDILQANASDA